MNWIPSFLKNHGLRAIIPRFLRNGATIGITLVVTAYSLAPEEGTDWPAYLPLMILLLFVAGGIQFWEAASSCRNDWMWASREDRYEDKRFTFKLSGVLDAAASYIKFAGNCGEGKLNKSTMFRICVHVRMSRNDKNWKQQTHYFGSGPKIGQGKDRIVDVTKGIVGYSFRTGEMKVVSAKTPEQRKDLFLKAFGYEEDEISKGNIEARSWISIPVGQPGENNGAQAVIFADSNSPDFFDEKDGVRVTAMSLITSVVAKMLNETYNRGEGGGSNG